MKGAEDGTDFNINTGAITFTLLRSKLKYELNA
jgi:hypothetical protein